LILDLVLDLDLNLGKRSDGYLGAHEAIAKEKGEGLEKFAARLLNWGKRPSCYRVPSSIMTYSSMRPFCNKED
jgi:hypothetical protein